MAFTPKYSTVAPNAVFGGPGYGRLVDITLDSVSAYPAGGFSLTSPSCGIADVLGFDWLGNSTAAEGYVPELNTTTGYLQIMVANASGSALAEFAGTFAANVAVRGWIIGY